MSRPFLLTHYVHPKIAHPPDSWLWKEPVAVMWTVAVVCLKKRIYCAVVYALPFVCMVSTALFGEIILSWTTFTHYFYN